MINAKGMLTASTLGLALVACGSQPVSNMDAGAEAGGDAGATDSGTSDAPRADVQHADVVNTDVGSTDSGNPGNDGGTTGCAPLPAHDPVVLADFESGSVPSSDTSPEGFRGTDVARGTIVQPGAAGSANAAEFRYDTDNAVFFQGSTRRQYLDGSPTYTANLANAVEFYLEIPSGSALFATSGNTLGFWTYHWKPGDDWVGTNSTGGNLTDSQMHGYSNMRFDAQGAGRFLHVVLTPSAFQQSRGNYHFYAARAVVEDLQFFAALRQFEIVAETSLSAAPSTLRLDQLRLLSLPPTATVCPDNDVRTVPAAGGDVRVPITLTNSTSHARTYRAFISSEIGVDRQTLEVAMHDADSVAAIDDLQGAVGADGSLGAVELFAADAAGAPTGPSIVGSGTEISLAAGASFRGVLVHHVTPAMLGNPTMVSTGGHDYTVRRDTLTTSVIFWDPNEPRVNDPAVVWTGSNSDSGHPAPPGFPTYSAPPAGWASANVPPDQEGAYFVSVLRLTP